MRIKIGDITYDSNREPMMVILSGEEKDLISRMGEQTYLVYPEDMLPRTLIIKLEMEDYPSESELKQGS